MQGIFPLTVHTILGTRRRKAHSMLTAGEGYMTRVGGFGLIETGLIKGVYVVVFIGPKEEIAPLGAKKYIVQ